MLAAIVSWFTPTVLFCLVNLVIATIFLSHKKTMPDPTQPVSLLQRVRSITLNPYSSDPTHNPTFLQRVRSINLSFNHDQDPTQEPTQTPSLLQRVRSIKLSPFTFTTDEPDPTQGHHRSESEPVELARPDPEEAVSAPARMRKSASVRTRPTTEETEKVRRPSTVREKKATTYGGDDEVDVKADDFINKFKQQLKLQRLDSLVRYKEMLHRGASR